MARSDQQHTTRLIAHYLGMNYARGLEFVELTLGDQSDRNNLQPNENNFHGLHGNAILSKCKISDGKIIRNAVGQYFDTEGNAVNAGGLEKRLGGRMILLGRVVVDGTTVVVGSINQLGLNGLTNDIKDYTGTSQTIIAGDQSPSFGEQLGLDVIVASGDSHPTWPASCHGLGEARRDNIYSNLKVADAAYVLKPCFRHSIE
jgi:hypothetical protein